MSILRALQRLWQRRPLPLVAAGDGKTSPKGPRTMHWPDRDLAHLERPHPRNKVDRVQR